MAFRTIGLGVLLVGITASLAMAAPLPRHGSFVFSGLCSRHNGDVIGSRLTLVRLDGDDILYYEWSNLFAPGGPHDGPFGTNVAPGLQGASAVTVHIGNGGMLRADLGNSDAQMPRLVEGQLSDGGFTLSGFEATIWLPRQRDLGAKIPVCPEGPPHFDTQK